MREVEEFLRSKGFDPGSITPDAIVHRFARDKSKDSAWYIAWQNARIKDGTFYYICVFGDWRTGEKHLYKPDNLTKPEKKAVEEQIHLNQKKTEEDLRQLNIENADVAAKRYAEAPKQGSTPYLNRKNISLHGACLYQDRVQVPMRDVSGKIWNLQSIFPDGQKRFMSKARKKGTFYVIGGPIDKEAFICEGFATGASIWEATAKTVVVAFDAGNMTEVVKELKFSFPDLLITVCGDDDRFNPQGNVGREKAEKAQLLCSGALVFPIFPEEDKSSTDFNDLHVVYGLDKVREQLIETPPERTTGFIPLGYEDQTYFFYHIGSKDIVKCTNFTVMQMYRLAPMDYWEANYPTKKGADLNKAAHDLIQQCSAIGPFDGSRVRGTGVWRDDKRVVVNTGHNLIVDGKETPLTSHRSWRIYIQTRNRIPPIHKVPLTAEEGKHLVRVCQNFRWKKPMTDSLLLCGWIMQARIAGALSVRPHVWLTGGKGSGKSTLMESFIAPLLGSPKGKIHLIGTTTEAGIRQDIKASSQPIIYDEFESQGRGSRDRIDGVVELLRSSWSISQGKVLKGSASGSSVDYQLNCSGLLSSIRVRLENDADRSRFCVLELNSNGENPEQWKMLRPLLAAINEELGERLFARAIKFLPEIVQNQAVLQRYLAARTSQRFGQQYGSLLAAVWALENDNSISEEEAAPFCEEFVGEVEDEIKENEILDHEECLLVLTSRKFDLRNPANGFMNEMSFAQAVRDNHWHSVIKLYGIKIVGDRFLIANKHAELEKIYRGSRWEGNWARALARLPEAVAGNITSFGSRGTTSRCVSLPISLL